LPVPGHTPVESIFSLSASGSHGVSSVVLDLSIGSCINARIVFHTPRHYRYVFYRNLLAEKYTSQSYIAPSKAVYTVSASANA
jgi:hypothetical protein